MDDAADRLAQALRNLINETVRQPSTGSAQPTARTGR